MKIAQITPFVPPYGSGIGVVAHYYATELTKKGHQVEVFTPKNKNLWKMDRNYKLKPLFPFLNFKHTSCLPQLIWRLWKFDVIHFHYPFLGSGLLVLLVKMLKGDKVKLFLNYHLELEPTKLKKILLWFNRKFLLPRLIKLSEKIIVSSVDYIENSQIEKNYFKNPQKFAEIPFGVQEAYQKRPKDLELLNKYGLTEDDFVVLFVGSLSEIHYFKGINYLIRAISLLENKKIKALIVGGGNLKKDYENLAKNLKIEDKVIFTDYIENEILPEYYNLADVFILPSINKTEAFSLVLLEALASGVPVIASNLKGVRKVVEPGHCGLLFSPKNSRDIKEKIIYLYERPKLRQKFSRTACKKVLTKYRWSIIVSKIEKLYLGKQD